MTGCLDTEALLTLLAWERIAPGGWFFFSRLICLAFGLCFVLKGGQIHLQFSHPPHPLSTGSGARFLFGGNLDEGDSKQSGVHGVDHSFVFATKGSQEVGGKICNSTFLGFLL
jgi:hypothetical protein